jgi:4-hydroxy-2-oxoheptanedioate aldolase
MQFPKNHFLHAMRQGESWIGLWLALTDPNAAEALAGCGFDWLLLDGEHAPNDVRSILEQLRAVAPYPVAPIVRIAQADATLVKQHLDLGAQTLLVPMIDTPEQAAQMARAMRYPPFGIRGVGAGLARASRWNQVPRYLEQADQEVCLIVQAETPQALQNLPSIAATEGVDAVFFGPADLSTNMGLPGQVSHPEVQRCICEGIATVRAHGKAAGVLAFDPALATRYLQAGAQFIAVGADTSLLVQSAKALAQTYARPA